MSKALIDKLLRSRESKVEAGGHKFTIRRPTAADLGSLAASGKFAASNFNLELATRFVVGWDLTELDIVASGTPEPVAFDPELWAAWVADRLELWAPLGEAIIAERNAYDAKIKEDAKN